MFIFKKKQRCTIDEMFFDYWRVRRFSKNILEKWTHIINLNRRKCNVVCSEFSPIEKIVLRICLWSRLEVYQVGLTLHWLTFDGIIVFSWLINCSIVIIRWFSFGWNGWELSFIIQSSIRWVMILSWDFLLKMSCSWRFSIGWTNGRLRGFTVWQYSLGQTFKGMRVVVTRGAAEKTM